jgi:hypothetical protein
MTRQRLILAVAGAAVVLVGGLSAYLLTGTSTLHYQPKSLPIIAPSVTPSIAAASPAGAVARSTPVRIVIPSIGVNAPVDQEWTDAATGSLQVPPLSGPHAMDTGWWAGGFTPGQAGQSVIAGHIDSAAMGHLVFWNLGKLTMGDMVEVQLADGASVWFTYVTSQEVSKSDPVFWPRFWKSAQTAGAPTLSLITCGGDFNPATGHYTDNLVVDLKAVPTG